MRLLLIGLTLLLFIIGAPRTASAECELLHPGGLNKTCRAAQSPTIERVNLQVTVFTFPIQPQSDYCRLDVVFTGDFSSLKAALDENRVTHGGWKALRVRGSDIDLEFVAASGSDLRASISGYSYGYLNSYGLPSGLDRLSTTSSLVWQWIESGTRYQWDVPIPPPRESANPPALFLNCMHEIELAREKQERKVYITKHEIAVEMARQAALTEIAFLDGEVATMETALSDIQVLITQASEAINTALEKRRKLIILEEQYAETINAFWAEQTQAYMTFSAWAYERLDNIDQQIAQAEEFKATIQQLEAEFQAELQATRERIREKVKELEELATNGKEN